MGGRRVDAEIDGHERRLRGVEPCHDVRKADTAAEQTGVADDERACFAVGDPLQRPRELGALEHVAAVVIVNDVGQLPAVALADALDRTLGGARW